MIAYPVLFNPILKPKVWGGRWLANVGKKLPPKELMGESWELADLPESIEAGRSIIANGTATGRTLHDVLVENPKSIMGSGKLSKEGGFPLLIKYLDAQQNLSVQVHPDEKYAAAHPDAHLKSEAWFIIHAAPSAVIYKGVKPHVTPGEFAQHIRANTVVDDLIAVPVKPGDCHYLPSGTCHALGAGIVVAEIQTPSDTTFRVYDWGRSGPGRELHIDQALQCIHFGEGPREPRLPGPIQINGVRTTPLVQTPFFEFARLDVSQAIAMPIVLSGLPEVWMILAGGATIRTRGGESTLVTKGTTTLIPASAVDPVATFEPKTSLLRIQLPSPLKGMIA